MEEVKPARVSERLPSCLSIPSPRNGMAPRGRGRRSSTRRQSTTAAAPSPEEGEGMELDDSPAANRLDSALLPSLPNGDYLDTTLLNGQLPPLPPLPALEESPTASPSSSKPPRASFGGYTSMPTMFGGLNSLPARSSPRQAATAAATQSFYPEASTSSQPSISQAGPARQYSQAEVAAWRNQQVNEKQEEVRTGLQLSAGEHFELTLLWRSWLPSSTVMMITFASCSIWIAS